jgi:hypothetical protein
VWSKFYGRTHRAAAATANSDQLKLYSAINCSIAIIILLNFSDLNILTKAAVRAYDAAGALLSSLTESLNSQGMTPVNDLSAVVQIKNPYFDQWNRPYARPQYFYRQQT